MNSQSQSETQPITPSKSFSNSHLLEIRRYLSRRRCCLGSLAAIVLLVMAIGVLFAAHQYYKGFGGQRWLRKRGHTKGPSIDMGNLYLPLRQIEISGPELALRGSKKRFAQQDIPFYACGDQQNSCEQYGQPNVCCPVAMTCYAIKSITPSGIFCCNSSASVFQCQASESHPPKCLAPLVECSAETGGGCCPEEDICSPNGCIHSSNSSFTGSLLQSTTSTEIRNPTVGLPASLSSESIRSLAAPGIIVTSTIIEMPAATYTVVKEGEVAQIGAGVRKSVMMTLFVPYSCGWLLAFVAAMMAMM